MVSTAWSHAVVAAVIALVCSGQSVMAETQREHEQSWEEGTVVTKEPLLQSGTGRFVATDDSSGVTSSVHFSGGDVQLNFVDVDIQEFVRALFEEVLAANYIMDPGLRGNVTVRTNSPVPRKQAYAIAAEVLRMNGASLSKRGDIYRVFGGSLSSGKVGDAVRVVPLRYVLPSQVEGALKQFGASAAIQANDAGRYLMMSGSAGDLDGLERLISVLDVNQLKGMSIGLFKLEQARPDQLIAELSQVFGKLTEADASSVRFLPISRINAVLALSSQPAYLEQIRDWVGRLDQADRDRRQIYVYPVQNRRSEELAKVLRALVGKGMPSSADEPPVARVQPGLTEQAFQTANAVGSFSKASSSRETDGFERDPTESGNRKSAVEITADKSTNSLLIYSTPEGNDLVLSALRRIDSVPLQVLIEATVAEVTLNDRLRYGVRWYFDEEQNAAGFTDGASRVLAETFPGFNYFLSAPKVRVVLSALGQVTNVNIVSSPSLTVLDNETARLQVGDQVPIATRTATNVTDAGAPVVNDIELKDTGVILSVTPRVNASGLVVLDIVQEVSDVVETTSSNIDSPTIRQRKISSSIAVNSGTAIVLGGLIARKREKTIVGVPLLMRIPKVGNLFKRTVTAEDKTELLVLIRPVVMRNQFDAEMISREMSERLLGITPPSSGGSFKD